jgi:hypothetical protein
VLEKALLLDNTALANIASWLNSFIKAFNNYLFKLVLDRSIRPSDTPWKWTFSKDNAKFKKLYQAFATTLDSIPSPLIEEIYSRFKAAKKPRLRPPGPVPAVAIV